MFYDSLKIDLCTHIHTYICTVTFNDQFSVQTVFGFMKKWRLGIVNIIEFQV